MLAGDGPHGHDPHGSAVAGAVKHAAHFDAAARKPLESLRHFVPDLLDHHQRILDRDRAFGRRVQEPEFRRRS